MPEPTSDKLQNHTSGETLVTSLEAATSPNILLPGLEHLEYNELFELYRQSPYGLHQAKQTPRYAQVYTYDHSQILIDLGDDVHPVEHMQHTHDTVTQPFVVAHSQELTAREVVVLRLGTFLHDIGECTFPGLASHGELLGDTAYGQKVEGEETNEQRLRQRIVEEVWPEIPADLLAEIDEMIMEPESKLGHMFNSIERLGYLRTGIEASEVLVNNYRGELVTELARDPWSINRLLQLSLLASQVANINPELEKPFQQHYNVLNERRRDYPYIDTSLGEIDSFLILEGNKRFGRLPTLIAAIESMK